MSKGMAIKSQVAFIKEQLRKKGIEPDLIDVEALVDSELSYKENLKNILGQAGTASGKVGSKETYALTNPACDGKKEIDQKIKTHMESDPELQKLKSEAQEAKTRCSCANCTLMGLADPHDYPEFPESMIIKEGGLVVQRTLPPAGKFTTQLKPERKIKAKITGPESVYQLVKDMGDEDREFGKVLYLDTKNQVTGIDIITVGSLNAAIVHPREVFKGAVLNNAASIIFVHNHPSGNPEPSKEDVALSHKLKETGDTIGITLLDSVVIGKGTHYSMKENNMIADPHTKEKSIIDEFLDFFDDL